MGLKQNPPLAAVKSCSTAVKSYQSLARGRGLSMLKASFSLDPSKFLNGFTMGGTSFRKKVVQLYLCTDETRNPEGTITAYRLKARNLPNLTETQFHVSQFREMLFPFSIIAL